MGKYEPLTAFLAAKRTQEVPMSFTDIEKVIGTPLPDSKRHPAWWSNNAANNVMTRAWLAAGFRTERVDICGERLVFRRAGPPPAADEGAGESTSKSSPGGGGLLQRLRARLGGSVTVAPGVDLTAPSGERWDAEG